MESTHYETMKTHVKPHDGIAAAGQRRPSALDGIGVTAERPTANIDGSTHPGRYVMTPTAPGISMDVGPAAEHGQRTVQGIVCMVGDGWPDHDEERSKIRRQQTHQASQMNVIKMIGGQKKKKRKKKNENGRNDSPSSYFGQTKHEGGCAQPESIRKWGEASGNTKGEDPKSNQGPM